MTWAVNWTDFPGSTAVSTGAITTTTVWPAAGPPALDDVLSLGSDDEPPHAVERSAAMATAISGWRFIFLMPPVLVPPRQRRARPSVIAGGAPDRAGQKAQSSRAVTDHTHIHSRVGANRCGDVRSPARSEGSPLSEGGSVPRVDVDRCARAMTRAVRGNQVLELVGLEEGAMGRHPTVRATHPHPGMDAWRALGWKPGFLPSVVQVRAQGATVKPVGFLPPVVDVLLDPAPLFPTGLSRPWTGHGGGTALFGGLRAHWPGIPTWTAPGGPEPCDGLGGTLHSGPRRVRSAASAVTRWRSRG